VTGRVVRRGIADESRSPVPLFLPPQVIRLRVKRYDNDGDVQYADCLDADRALGLIQAFMAVPGTYQIMIDFFE
jgi:hypothetical protein